MRTVIQGTNLELDTAMRRTLDSQLLRDMMRFTKDVDVATAYISNEKDVPHCSLAVQCKDNRRLATESSGVTYLDALIKAGGQMAGSLQREIMRRTDPRLNRKKP